MTAVLYLDASALVKLGKKEAETEALRRSLRGSAFVFTSAISMVEVARAFRRAVPDEADDLTETVLARVDVHALTDAVIAAAARLDPPSLRTLDALHLSTALELRNAITGFVTYDARLAEAATVAGLPVAAPR